jgi:hypothetical protein
LKVYLSVPLVAGRALDRANLIARAIVDSGNEVSSPWVLGELGNDPSTNVFDRDKEGAQSCDVLVADVGSPSTGVGMEVMAAYIAGVRIILVTKKGDLVSRMLRHMDRKEVIEYRREDEIYGSLKKLLSTGMSRAP